MKNNYCELTNKRAFRFAALAVGGILTGLMAVFPGVGFLQWITLIPAAMALFSVAEDKRVRCRGLYGYGVFFFMCYYPVVYHWFINLYPLDFVDGMTPLSAMAVVLLGVFGLSALQASMGGLVFVAVGYCFRGSIAEKAPWLKPLLAAGAWSVFEWTQTLGWIGVPWGRLALGQTEYAVGIQTASLFGPYFITFLLVAVNFALGFVLHRILKGERKLAPTLCGMAVAMLLFQYGAGTALYLLGGEKEEGTGVKVAALQGNISSNEKWSLSANRKIFEVYSRLAEDAARDGADIILMPESALPFSIEEGEHSHYYLKALAASCGVPVIGGGFTNAEEGEYNSLVCFMPDGRVLDCVYSKRHLVPFGEYVPMEGLIKVIAPPLSELVMGGYKIVPGEGAQLMEIDSLKIGSLICFDSIYEGLALESVREGAEVIFLATNDSWFTDSAALDMHNAQAKLRAVECGRYVVRAANTGISSVITPRGETVTSLGALEEGYIIGEIYPKSHTTLYSIIGNIFVYLWCAAFFALVIYEKIHRKKI